MVIILMIIQYKSHHNEASDSRVSFQSGPERFHAMHKSGEISYRFWTEFQVQKSATYTGVNMVN